MYRRECFPIHMPTKQQRWHIAEAQRFMCIGCGKPLNRSKRLNPNSRDAMTIDHVISQSAGGPDRLGNVLVMHMKCNSAKGDRRPTGCERLWAGIVLLKMR